MQYAIRQIIAKQSISIPKRKKKKKIHFSFLN